MEAKEIFDLARSRVEENNLEWTRHDFGIEFKCAIHDRVSFEACDDDCVWTYVPTEAGKVCLIGAFLVGAEAGYITSRNDDFEKLTGKCAHCTMSAFDGHPQPAHLFSDRENHLAWWNEVRAFAAEVLG